MRHDVRIKRVLRKYGADGYALYNYILESIAGNLSAKNPLPDLEETSDDIAFDLNIDTLRVQEIVSFCVNEGLFTQDEMTGHIMCVKMYKFLDDATRKSAAVVKMLESFSNIEVGLLPSKSEKVPPDKDKEGDKDIEKEFNNFWNLYNNKKDRKKCFAKWKKLTEEQKDKIFTTLPRYVKNTILNDSENKTGKFIPFRKNPSTYLNNESWNDEITEVQQPSDKHSSAAYKEFK